MVGSFTMEKENLYLLMFERAATSHTLANGVTFNQPNSLNDNQVIKEIIEKHKNLLMLRDNIRPALQTLKLFFNITISLHNQIGK